LEKNLHIVCLDVPYPVDYGGVFDLFYKLPVLKEQGVKIHLHCFQYGRAEQPILNEYCESVHYYPRNEGHKGFSTQIPYIVCSRSHPALLENLLKDDHPILFEGVHCTYFVGCEKLAGRRLFLRLYNVECEYYGQLCKHENSLLKKAYFYNEKRLLEKYESDVASKMQIFAVSQKDVEVYQQKFKAKSIHYLPIFLPYTKIMGEEGVGNYCLYHGNLSVSENEMAATWLLEKVFSKIKIPFVIAGKKPSARLQRLAHTHCHTCLIENPGDDEMKDLITKAQVNILPSFNKTGIKLKLLNALFNGRHCVVNDDAVEQTGLEPACHIGSTPESFQRIIMQLYHHPFCDEEIRLRKKLLLENYDNSKNAKKLIEWIW